MKTNFLSFFRVAVLDRFYCRLNIVLKPTLSRYIHSDKSVSTLIAQLFYGKMILWNDSQSMLQHINKNFDQIAWFTNGSLSKSARLTFNYKVSSLFSWNIISLCHSKTMSTWNNIKNHFLLFQKCVCLIDIPFISPLTRGCHELV